MKTKPVPMKKPPGRPRQIAADGDASPLNVRVSAVQKAKVHLKGGGPWVRELVDKARERTAGSKPLDEELLVEATKINVRFSGTQRSKVQRNGGAAWVRSLIDKAPG